MVFYKLALIKAFTLEKNSLTILNVPELEITDMAYVKDIDYGGCPILIHNFFGEYLTIGNHKHKPQHLYVISDDYITENDFFIQHNEEESILRKAVSYDWYNKYVRDVATTENYLHDYYDIHGYYPYPMVFKTLQDEMEDSINGLKDYREKVICSTNSIIKSTVNLTDDFLFNYIYTYNNNEALVEIASNELIKNFVI